MRPSILSVLVKNRFGVLTKVTMLFGRRGCNIHSLAVDITHTPKLSRITVTVYETDDKVEQIYKQLKKLEDVQEVLLFKEDEAGFVEREIALLKLKKGIDINAFDWDKEALFVKKLHESNGSCLVEVMGPAEHVKGLILEIGEENIDRLTRSGRVALGLES